MKNIQFMLIQLLFRPFYGDGFIMGLSQSLTKAATLKVKFPGIGMLKFRMDQRRQIWSEPECSVVECYV